MSTITLRRNRQTGTTVTVGSAADLGLCDGAGVTRWYTCCEAHSQYLGHPTRAHAEQWAPYPKDWCAGCNPTLEDPQ